MLEKLNVKCQSLNVKMFWILNFGLHLTFEF
jgi:hypothetical protein